ncbi:serpin B8-like isoform X2 [Ornithodoros turicata]
MFLNTSLELADAFKDAVQQDYFSQLGIVNLQGDPALAVREINSWLQKITGNKLAGMLLLKDIAPTTRMLMVNATFLRCLWLEKFSELYTAPMPFMTDDGEVLVPTMCSRRVCNYCHVEHLSCRVLELPCMHDQLRLLILLPDRQSDLTYLEDNLLAEDVPQFEKNFTRNPLEVTLPKFALEHLVFLSPYMRAVGILDMFDKDRADFTGMSDTKGLCVHDFVTKARLEVTDEDPLPLSVNVTPLRIGDRCQLPTFEVNRPFMFIIIESVRKRILCLGCLKNPASKQQ